MNVLTSLFFFCLTCGMVTSTSMSCLGENGKPVDMYILYKLPKMKHSTSEVLKNGTGYAYFDSDMLDAGVTKFKLSTLSIGAMDSVPGHTMNQVYEQVSRKSSDNQAHVFYNDENADGFSFESNGHTKGAIAFDTNSGFWLIHSVPRAYPPPVSSEGYSFPESGQRYGQMFVCVTFNVSVFDDIGFQLRVNNPHVHDSHLPEAMAERFPNIKKLIDDEMQTDSPYYSVVKVASNSSRDFISFAKYTTFNKDLYSSLVAPTLKSALMTETWQHENRININSTCDTTYTVEDISSIHLTCQQGEEIQFSNFHDHSKFAVGKAEPYVCVGDINRQVSQYHRGGGTLCTQDERLHGLFYQLVDTVNSCT